MVVVEQLWSYSHNNCCVQLSNGFTVDRDPKQIFFNYTHSTSSFRSIDSLVCYKYQDICGIIIKKIFLTTHIVLVVFRSIDSLVCYKYQNIYVLSIAKPWPGTECCHFDQICDLNVSGRCSSYVHYARRQAFSVDSWKRVNQNGGTLYKKPKFEAKTGLLLEYWWNSCTRKCFLTSATFSGQLVSSLGVLVLI